MEANGNLAQIVGCKQHSTRLHEWDEENRLRFVLGERYAGYYGYDAGGARVYKLTGTSGIDQVNSGHTKAHAVFDHCVLYPNPYIVVTPKGYTKHYYAGTERLATVLGCGGFSDMTYPFDGLSSPHEQEVVKSFHSFYSDYDSFHHEKEVSTPIKTVDIDGARNPDLEYNCSPVVLDYLDVLATSDILHSVISENEKINCREKDIYYYHADHLGSASWITDQSGTPIQYIHYAPYGELVENQRANGYDERFKFTGKERDAESGYDYFGARYFWSKDGIWLSVDPLSDKYLWISPYAYCAWNPVKYVDPNGEWFEIAWDIANVVMDVRSLVSNIKEGNIGGAIADGAGLVLDVAATVLPGIPGGAGSAITAYRAADNVVDAGQTTNTIVTGIAATQNTYRKALQAATGKIGKGYEAHHTLPQKYRGFFDKLGINIDEQGNVVWRKRAEHQKGNRSHEKAWDLFLEQNPDATKDEILQHRDRIEIDIWNNAKDNPLE